MASTALSVVLLWWVVDESWDWQDGPAKYLVLSLALLPLLSPTVALIIQYTVVVLRRVSVRLRLYRARTIFRAALLAARRHPELADTARLREAAKALSGLPPADVLRLAPELAEAARHGYAPIREAGRGVMRAVGGVLKEARSGPTSSLN